MLIYESILKILNQPLSVASSSATVPCGFPQGAALPHQSGARLLSSNDCFLNAIHNVLHILITNIRSCGQSHADLEDVFFNAIGINLTTSIHGLLVHGLPYGAALHLLAKHKHAHGLNILVGLAVPSQLTFGRACSRLGESKQTSLSSHLIAAFMFNVVWIKYRFVSWIELGHIITLSTLKFLPVAYSPL